MESLIHWSILRSPQYTSLAPLTLRNQSFQPLVGFGQDRKVSFHGSKEKFSALKGILLVSALIIYQWNMDHPLDLGIGGEVVRWG